MKDNYILAIETSCDDTSIAILNNNIVLACVTKDSTKELNMYGGIVPEIASRKHEEYIVNVFKECLKSANIDEKQIQYICYTSEPGLPGSLHVGEIFAKTLSFLLDIPFYPINHIHAHIFSSFINSNVEYPFMSLIASGKTTSIYLINSVNDIKELIKTSDDAVGETFDKVSKYLGYGYPGGPEIDKRFNINKATIKFKTQEIEKDFSFSGIKSNILRIINDSKKNNLPLDDVTIASSFMKWAIDTLIRKLKFFKDKYNIEIITIGGGVSANSLFKSEIKRLFKKSYIPNKEYSCDNAAMIGYLFYEKYLNKTNI